MLTQDSGGRRKGGLEPQRRYKQVQVSQIVIICLISFKSGRKNESNWTKPLKSILKTIFKNPESQVLRSAGLVKVLLGGRETRHGLKANLTEFGETKDRDEPSVKKDSRMCLDYILLFVFLQVLVPRSCFPHDSSLKLYNCKRHLPTSLLGFLWGARCFKVKMFPPLLAPAVAG